MECFLFQDWTLFHCWKENRNLKLSRKLRTPENERLHGYSPWIRYVTLIFNWSIDNTRGTLVNVHVCSTNYARMRIYESSSSRERRQFVTIQRFCQIDTSTEAFLEPWRTWYSNSEVERVKGHQVRKGLLATNLTINHAMSLLNVTTQQVCK